MSLPKIGLLAPNFKLENQAGELVELKNFKNKSIVVIYFYPKAMTPGCTVQACGLRDGQKNLKKLGVTVFGISPDPINKLVKFIEKEELNFDLLSDPDHSVASVYGSWGTKKFMGKVYDGILRQTFIIGKDGKLKHVIENVKTKTHFDEVYDYIKTNLS
jgi:peroxiredoxin Q/BCP